MKILANNIVNWLRDYAVTHNREAFVVGVSGGVDSALVSTLCAMTGLPTHCAILPCHSKPDQTKNGEVHIDWLARTFGNIAHHNIDLTSTFDAFADSIDKNHQNDLAFANTKSRLRMIALYQIATCESGLVVGTGNKVEDDAIGFCTKGGDGLVDISPIGDLLKSEVRQMCHALEVLPELANAIPTDGLWADGRTDESAIGATYDELEWALEYQNQKTPDTSFLSDRQVAVLEIYNKWHNSTRHKFNPIPTFRRATQRNS